MKIKDREKMSPAGKNNNFFLIDGLFYFGAKRAAGEIGYTFAAIQKDWRIHRHRIGGRDVFLDTDVFEYIAKRTPERKITVFVLSLTGSDDKQKEMFAYNQESLFALSSLAIIRSKMGNVTMWKEQLSFSQLSKKIKLSRGQDCCHV